MLILLLTITILLTIYNIALHENIKTYNKCNLKDIL